MNQVALIRAYKVFKEGDAHLDGTVGTFNAIQASVLDDAARMNRSGNYQVRAIILMQYGRENPCPHIDAPTGEVARWEAPT